MARYVLLAFAALAAILAIVYHKKVQASWLATKKFIREVRVEMQKVSWPSRNDVIGSTVVVMIAVIVMTLIVTAADQVLATILDVILQRKA